MPYSSTGNMTLFSNCLYCIQYNRGDNRNRTGDRGVADLCLTAWLCRLNNIKAPRVGLEPTTQRLTAVCSTD